MFQETRCDQATHITWKNTKFDVHFLSKFVLNGVLMIFKSDICILYPGEARLRTKQEIAEYRSQTTKRNEATQNLSARALHKVGQFTNHVYKLVQFTNHVCGAVKPHRP